MNGAIFLLYINTIASHHAFIKTFTERESMSVVSFSFHQQNVFDGRLMRAYQSVFQYFYIFIHHERIYHRGQSRYNQSRHDVSVEQTERHRLAAGSRQ